MRQTKKNTVPVMDKKDLIEKAVSVFRDNERVLEAFLFGSYSRGEQKPSSDLDFIVTFRDDSSLFDVSDLRRALCRQTRLKIHVLSSSGLSDRFKRAVGDTKEKVYERQPQA